MNYFIAACSILLVLVATESSRGQNRNADQQKIKELTAEVDRLSNENQILRDENAQLKQKLAAMEKGGTERSPAEKPAAEKPALALGAPATLGAYTYNVPEGFVNQNVKNTPLGAVYRSKDKNCAVLVRVRVKGAAIPEMQNQFTASIIQEMKQQFTRDKTQVVEPPAAQNDNRFFAKVRERTKAPGGEVATQWHIYRNLNRDMIEMTAITTFANDQDITAFQKLAEEMMMSFRGK